MIRRDAASHYFYEFYFFEYALVRTRYKNIGTSEEKNNKMSKMDDSKSGNSREKQRA